MKKMFLCLLSLVCAACLFTACNKEEDARYKITFQDLSVLPEGVESVKNGQGTMASGSGNDETIYFTAEYGSSSIVNGKSETHKIAFDPSTFVEITSVEIVLAN